MVVRGEIDPAGAARVLADRLGRLRPRHLLVLGSGLGGLASAVEDPVTVPFEVLPGFPPAGVGGHAGRFLAGRLEGRSVLVQSGRYHVYEGHPLSVVTAPVRMAAELGVVRVLLTNAAGGIGPGLEPGALMLLNDHLNLQLRSPLAGPVREGEARLPDMSAPYDPELSGLAVEAARARGIRLRRGVYAAVTGPSFETPAEIRMLARAGADAVGMSTVPSVLTARAAGLAVLAVSMITNRAAGLSPEPLSHEEVVAVGRRAGAALERVVRGVLAGASG